MILKKIQKYLVISAAVCIVTSNIQYAAYAALPDSDTASSKVESNVSNKSVNSDKQTSTNNEEQEKQKDNKTENNGNIINNDKIENNHKVDTDKEENTDKEDDKKEEEVMPDGWNEIKGKRYYVVDNNIVQKKGWFKESSVTSKKSNNENEYYLNDDHSAVVGWKQIGDKWYYFNELGILQHGWIDDGGNKYYTDEDGVMLSGLKQIGRDKYYFDYYGKMVTGKLSLDNKFYFFNFEGKLETGFYKNNGKTYYSDEDGVMVTDKWIHGKRYDYYVKSDGTLAIGHIYLDGKIYDFDENGKLNGTVNKEEDLLYIEFLNVGNADCAFIKLPSGETVLIDTGDVTTSKEVENFLKKQNLSTKLVEVVSKDTDDSETQVINSEEDVTEEKSNTVNNEKSDLNIENSSEQEVKADSDIKEDNKKTVKNGESDKVNDTKVTEKKSLAEVINEAQKLDKNSQNKDDSRKAIDYVVLTHPHSDHIGGMIDVLKNYKIGQVFIPKYFELKDYSKEITGTSAKELKDKEIIENDYKIYEDTVKALEKSNAKVTEIVPGKYIDSQKILQFKSSNKDFVKMANQSAYDKYAAYNNNSAIVYLDYKDLQVLFTGDIEWNAEIDFVDRDALEGKEVDVLKVPHHGLNTSSSYIFVGYVKPSVAVISRSKDSISNNQSQNINETFAVCGVNKYETSEDDGVSLYSTKDNWSIIKNR